MVVLLEQDTLVCRCLQVCESELLGALDRCSIRNLQDVARETGAGSGCMSCHRMIRRYLAGATSAGCTHSAACLGTE
jgi:NAD(P)H-nitrite reductase large subunit